MKKLLLSFLVALLSVSIVNLSFATCFPVTKAPSTGCGAACGTVCYDFTITNNTSCTISSIIVNPTGSTNYRVCSPTWTVDRPVCDAAAKMVSGASVGIGNQITVTICGTPGATFDLVINPDPPCNDPCFGPSLQVTL
jgi:hypothetical protein